MTFTRAPFPVTVCDSVGNAQVFSGATKGGFSSAPLRVVVCNQFGYAVTMSGPTPSPFDGAPLPVVLTDSNGYALNLPLSIVSNGNTYTFNNSPSSFVGAPLPLCLTDKDGNYLMPNGDGTGTFIGSPISGVLTDIIGNTLTITVGANGWTLPGEVGAWTYRIPITYSNSGASGGVKGVQVNILLDNTFNYGAALAGGLDIRITDADGQTILPYYIESYNSGTSASIWFKVDVADTSNHTAYLYYGNANGTVPAPVSTNQPPLGPFTHSSTFISPTGGPTNMQPENIINVGGTYYAVFTDLATVAGRGTVGMMHTTDPTQTTGWTFDGTMVDSGVSGRWASSPFIILDNGTYYIFYWDSATSSTSTINYATASSITGPYTKQGSLISLSASGWDSGSIAEPCVVPNYDGKGNYALLYMGSNTSSPGSGNEQVGMATASSITGPYTKNPANPIFPLGASGTVDNQISADPWVIQIGSTWYIGRSVSPNSSGGGQPWFQEVATTTDWVTFTKVGPTFGKGTFAPGVNPRWDCGDAHRGHPILVGSTWVQLYSGAATSTTTSPYNTGVMTAPLSAVSDIRNNADQVFDFWDGFDNASLNQNKWSISSGFGATISGSVIDINAGHSTQSMSMASSQSFGKNLVLECSAKFKTAVSTSTNALEIIMGQGDYANNGLRVMSFNNANFCSFTTHNGTNVGPTAISGATLDTASFHKVQIYWDGTTATFKFDSNSGTATPGITYNAWQAVIFLFYSSVAPELLVDWVRIRQWPTAESTVALGSVHTFPN